MLTDLVWERGRDSSITVKWPVVITVLPVAFQNNSVVYADKKKLALWFVLICDNTEQINKLYHNNHRYKNYRLALAWIFFHSQKNLKWIYQSRLTSSSLIDAKAGLELLEGSDPILSSWTKVPCEPLSLRHDLMNSMFPMTLLLRTVDNIPSFITLYLGKRNA